MIIKVIKNNLYNKLNIKKKFQLMKKKIRMRIKT
jgi:hypothetical protein